MPQGQQHCLELLPDTAAPPSAALAPVTISACLLLIQFSSSFPRLIKDVLNCRLLVGNKHSILDPDSISHPNSTYGARVVCTERSTLLL